MTKIDNIIIIFGADNHLLYRLEFSKIFGVKGELDMKRSFIREILEHITAETISFAGGLPDESLFPVNDLKNSAVEVLQDARSLQYSVSTGYEPLKEQIAEFYNNEGFHTTSENILITSGSQQALDIIARYHQNQKITVEAPSYLGAMNIFGLNRMELEAVKLENDGIDIDEFEKSFRQTKLGYLIPDFQNPTGRTYTYEKRLEVADIINKYEGILIEDAPYQQLYFNEKYPSMSSKLPDNSFHLGSFSKTLAPSLRIGWIRASTRLLKPLIAYKEVMDIHTNGLAQSILSHYLSSEGLYANHLEVLRKSYKEKMMTFANALDELLPQFVYDRPDGGMFIYGNLPNIDTASLVKNCLNKGVVFVPGTEFYTQDIQTDEIRFNYTHSSPENIYKGLEIIKQEMSEKD